MGKLRHGFTTGSCAAAAAKAATYMLVTGGNKTSITISTPKGIAFNAEILDIEKWPDKVRCGVLKDGGDDPDVTTGLIIYATVSARNDGEIVITGGEGVGLVTRPGLDQKVGEYAINSVPREMIEAEVRDVLECCEPGWGVTVEISAPGGEEVAAGTFNPRLGIEGGISILGTSGIVEPMSVEAIIETIRVELKQRKEEGMNRIAISPGNYGLEFMRAQYGFDMDLAVKCSNYIGAACDILVELGYERALLVGHSGKLVKIAGGIMNTHSREADSRMEIMAAHGLRKGGSPELLLKVLDSNTTDEAFGCLQEAGLMETVGESIVQEILRHLSKRAQGKVEFQCVMFSKELGLLGKSDGADAMIEELK